MDGIGILDTEQRKGATMESVVIQAQGSRLSRVDRVRELFIVGNANPLKRDRFRKLILSL
jgi:hypothetical protein